MPSRVVDPRNPVLGRVAGSAESGRSRAGLTLRVALFTGTSEICVVKLVVAIHAGAEGTCEVPEFGSITAGAGGGVCAGEADG